MIEQKKYRGVVVPMVSPFTEELSIDSESVYNVTDFLIRNSVTPFVLGTTGEAVSMSSTHKEMLVRQVIGIAKNRSPVFAGISGNSLSTSIREADRYAELGVDAVVASPPFYYPLDSNRMLHYFEQLANALSCPLILYNIPLTTKVSIPLEVIDTLSHHPNIAGIKDSENDRGRLEKSIELWKDRKDFTHLTGWAAMSVYGLQKGSHGIVPSAGNLVPGLYRDIYQSVVNEQVKIADELQEKSNYITSLYQKDKDLGQSIVALKMMLSVKGLCKPHVLPPLYRMDLKQESEYEKLLKAELEMLES